jgi:cell division protease FtsH
LKDFTKNIFLWGVILLVLLTVFANFGNRTAPTPEMPYSQFLTEVENNAIRTAMLKGESISGNRANGDAYVTYSPETDNTALIGFLKKHDVNFSAPPPEKSSWLMQLFLSSFPVLLLIGLWVYFMRQMQGGAGGRGAMSFGKSRARLLNEEQVSISFADVAGVEEA